MKNNKCKDYPSVQSRLAAYDVNPENITKSYMQYGIKTAVILPLYKSLPKNNQHLATGWNKSSMTLIKYNSMNLKQPFQTA
jgi:hypothetical protein